MRTLSIRSGNRLGGALGALAALLATVCCLLGPSGAAASGSYSVMDDEEKTDRLIGLIEGFVPRIESKWVDQATLDLPDGSPAECTADNGSYLQIPDAIDGGAIHGWFDACGHGVPFDRGLASVAYDYATLLAARPEQEEFGEVPRGTIEDHLEQTILQLGFGNDRNDTNTGDDPDEDIWWGGTECSRDNDHCEAGITGFQLAWAKYLIENDGNEEDQLSEAAAEAADETVIAEAEISAALSPHDGTSGNSYAEENVWESMLLSAAAAIYNSHPDNEEWDEKAKSFAINSAVTEADATDFKTSIDGKALGSWWAAEQILQPDYTLINHSFFNPLYLQGVMASLVDDQIMYKGAGAGVPSAFTWRQQTVWNEVIAGLTTDDGEIQQPAGTDWITHDYQHIPYLANASVRLGEEDATVLESRAIEKLAERQEEQPLAGSLYGMEDIGYEADVIRNVAEAYWIHAYWGPASVEQPSEAEFEAATRAWDGVRDFAGSNEQTIVNRQPNATSSMHWKYIGGMAYPTALIVPSAADHLDDPVLVQPWPASGVDAAGAVTYNCDCGSDYFSTAGTIGSHKFSMTSFPDGSNILLDKATANAFNMSFEGDEALWSGENDRPVYYEGGNGAAGLVNGAPPTGLSGNWMNVDDRYGLISRRAGGSPGMKVKLFDYHTRQGVDNPQLQIQGVESGETLEPRGALVLPVTTARETALVAADTRQPTVSDSEWTALTARLPDDTARIAVARWGGSAPATISNMSSSLGAPIPDRNADITVNSSSQGSMSVSAADLGNDNPGSIGWEGYFYVETDHTVTVHPVSPMMIKVTNGGSAATVTVRYADSSGAVHASQLALAANAIGYAWADVNGSEAEGVDFAVAKATSSASGHGPDWAIDASTGTYWSSNAGLPNQDLWIDYGRPIDLGGASMSPVSGNGPKDYELKASTSANCGDGSSGYSKVASVTGAASSGYTTTTWAGTRARCLLIHPTSSYGSLVKIADLVAERPEYDIDLVDPRQSGNGTAEIRLARGGWNTATVRIHNNTASSKSITITASGLPAGVTANSPSATVPAHSSADVQLNLTAGEAAPASGTTAITVSATGSPSETLTLAHAEDLALNDKGTTYPKATSTSEDPAFLFAPRLAFDGDTTSANDWFVTGPVAKLSTEPEDLTVDFGAAINVKKVTMTPRASKYGPTTYEIQTSTSGGCSTGSGFSTPGGGKVEGASLTTPTTTTLTSAVSARCVRIHILAAGSGEPEFTQAQVRELAVYPK